MLIGLVVGFAGGAVVGVLLPRPIAERARQTLRRAFTTRTPREVEKTWEENGF